MPENEGCDILPQIEQVTKYDDPRTELQKLRHVRYPQPKEVTEEAQENTRTIELQQTRPHTRRILNEVDDRADIQEYI